VSNEQDLKVILQNNLSTFVRFYTILRCRSVQLQRCINNEETNKCTLTLSILLSNLFLDRERNIYIHWYSSCLYEIRQSDRANK